MALPAVPVSVIFASAPMRPSLVMQVTRAGMALMIGSQSTNMELSLNRPIATVSAIAAKVTCRVIRPWLRL